MMDPPTKRLKRMFKDPNPLFTMWLMEWKAEAEATGSQMKYSYRIALKSLRQYPLPLTSGASCNILKGFGKVLCAKLDKKLKAYIETHGSLPNTESAVSPDRLVIGASTTRQRKPARKRPSDAQSNASQSSQVSSQEDASAASSATNNYHPKPGSGAYAVLVTLRSQEVHDDYPGYMHKLELQETAQALCTSSFTVPENGSYYTAWSSTSTLIKRSLMLRQGNPGRFSLTAKGRVLADQLIDSSAVAPVQRECFDRLASPGDVGPSTSSRVTNYSRPPRPVIASGKYFHHDVSTSGSDSDGAKNAALVDKTNNWASSSSGFNKRALTKVGKQSKIPQERYTFSVAPLSPSPEPELTAMKRASPIVHSQPKKPQEYVFNAAPPSPSPEPENVTSTPSETELFRPNRYDNLGESSAHSSADDPIVLSSDDEPIGSQFEKDDDNRNLDELEMNCSLTCVSQQQNVESDSLNDGCATTFVEITKCPSESNSFHSRSASTVSSEDLPGNRVGSSQVTGSTSYLLKEGEYPHSERKGTASSGLPTVTLLQADNNVPSSSSSKSSAASAPDDESSVVLFPGTFDVVLCVDNQETAGKNTPTGCLRSSRDVILHELQKNGVELDVRKLSVGDFLWVARPRDGRSSAELVLPYIIERKRMDDLAQSIRGSRYHEQKFRLKRCHVPNIIYLAESVGKGPRAAHLGLPEASLQQALVNCQVTDNFIVKRTADQRETAAFLTLMTRRLQRQFQSCRLQSSPPELLQLEPHSDTHRLLKFTTFNRISAKRQTLTVSDMFAKMLVQISGMSVDRAAAVISRYPTIQSLLKAYSTLSASEGEALLSTLRTEVTGKPLGMALSKTVYHLLSDPDLE